MQFNYFGCLRVTMGLLPVLLGKCFMPRIAMNSSFSDSSAAKGEAGEKGERARLSPEAQAMQQMMRGIHF
ncbi:hypothetical protein ABLV49_03620 [Polaromonas hydrogenivorans]|uniref:Uncharacterized protein n=1 Tax=Polaromonas hydrogenivorans TaxID=335476 RepID=A0AAU7LTI6_9BURK